MWAASLFGVSATEIGASVIDLEDVVGRSGRPLVDEVRSSPSWEARFAAIFGFLTRRQDGSKEPAADVAWAWEEIRRCEGALRIRDLAATIGWSERHFRRRFRDMTGLGPKASARIARFHRADRLISVGAAAVQVAGDCGFADQAHLSRELAALSRVPVAAGG